MEYVRLGASGLMGQPGVSAPVIGATKLGHVDDAITALDVELTGTEVSRLGAPYEPRLVTSYS